MLLKLTAGNTQTFRSTPNASEFFAGVFAEDSKTRMSSSNQLLLDDVVDCDVGFPIPKNESLYRLSVVVSTEIANSNSCDKDYAANDIDLFVFTEMLLDLIESLSHDFLS